jgi:hypothetical protein
MASKIINHQYEEELKDLAEEQAEESLKEQELIKQELEATADIGKVPKEALSYLSNIDNVNASPTHRTIATNTLRRNAVSTSLENVHQSVNTYDLSPAEKVFMQVIKNYLIVLKDNKMSRASRIEIVKTLFQHIACYKHFLSLEKYNTFNVTIKAKFHQFIHKEGVLSLIPIYNEIYNDGLYDSYEIPETIDLPEDFFADCLHEYRASLEELRIRNDSKKKKPKFSEGEIVGAKDKQGNWWLSRILKVWTYGIHIIYYVEFCGWGDTFNEFITNPYFIQKFNPRKHRLFRGVVEDEPTAKKEDML